MMRRIGRMVPVRLVAFTLALVALTSVATAQRTVSRWVIDFNVRCHVAPDLTSESGQAIGIAAEVTVGRVAQAGGANWYFLPGAVTTQQPSCWLYGPNTIASSETDALPSWLALIDHQLVGNNVTFEQFVELDNLLSDPGRRNIAGHQRLATSGLLRFRMLQLLEHVLHRAQRTVTALDNDPFTKAWLIAHDDTRVSYYGPGGVWLIPGNAYWDIYEQNKGAKWAEEVAWIASEHGPATDACETNCVLGSQIIGGPLQYWKRFPNGPHIAAALRHATDRAQVAGTCSELEETRELVKEIQISLVNVTNPEKRALLKLLSGLERPCPR